MMPNDFQLENADKFDFVQCEAGNSHTMLLNSLGQVFTFGEGLSGQLGIKVQKLHQDFPKEVEFPMRKGNRPTFIQRIKANASDSAAFDELSSKTYTWGSFGRLYMQGVGQKAPLYQPQVVDLNICRDDMDRIYALDPQNTNVPFAVGNLDKIDKINYVHTIDWGINHCVFLDRKDRMFSLGYNR